MTPITYKPLDGYGYGDCDGYGDCGGSGDGYGYGYSYSFGYGDGSGDGYGDFDCNGYGGCDSAGYGYGDCDGSGDGYGYGDDSIKYWMEVLKKITPQKQNQNSFLAFWRSNLNGTPANGGIGTKAKPGLVEEVSGPLELCTSRALHGTLNPPQWSGEKIWIVELFPPIAVDDDKVGSLKRRIVCETDLKL